MLSLKEVVPTNEVTREDENVFTKISLKDVPHTQDVVFITLYLFQLVHKTPPPFRGPLISSNTLIKAFTLFFYAWALSKSIMNSCLYGLIICRNLVSHLPQGDIYRCKVPYKVLFYSSQEVACSCKVPHKVLAKYLVGSHPQAQEYPYGFTIYPIGILLQSRGSPQGSRKIPHMESLVGIRFLVGFQHIRRRESLVGASFPIGFHHIPNRESLIGARFSLGF